MIILSFVNKNGDDETRHIKRSELFASLACVSGDVIGNGKYMLYWLPHLRQITIVENDNKYSINVKFDTDRADVIHLEVTDSVLEALMTAEYDKHTLNGQAISDLESKLPYQQLSWLNDKLYS